ncbi:TPA: hypothetical protein ACT9KA_002160, partial [Legionella pneumophila]
KELSKNNFTSFLIWSTSIKSSCFIRIILFRCRYHQALESIYLITPVHYNNTHRVSNALYVWSYHCSKKAGHLIPNRIIHNNIFSRKVKILNKCLKPVWSHLLRPTL